MSFRKMRLVPDEQYGGSYDEEPGGKEYRGNDYEDLEKDVPAFTQPITQPTTSTNENNNGNNGNKDNGNKDDKDSDDDMEYDKSVKRKRRIERDPDKIEKLIKIALKIALNNSYDDELRLKDFKGKSIENTYLPTLFKYILTPQKVIVGEEDFVRILFEAGVDPEWITNENFKAKLVRYYDKRGDKRKRGPSPPPFQPKFVREKERTFAKAKRKFNEKPNGSSLTPQETPLPEDSDDDELL